MSNVSSARAGARAGAVAAAGIAGALVGFGLRSGHGARPFNVMAALLLDGRARELWTFDALATGAGALVLLASCVVAGASLGTVLGARAIARRVARPRLLLFAVALVTGVAALAFVVLRAPSLVGPPPAGALSIGQGVALAIVAAAGFTSGMGLAR